MALQKLLPLVFLQLMIASLVFDVANAQGLKLGFYKKSCPSAEAIVKRVTHQKISLAPTLAAPLLRLHFHDCFIRGCDASVLINTTSTNVAEKSAPPNLSLRGYGVIDDVKAAVEKKCPGVVSCADIVALVARDAVAKIHGPSWPVPLGRRDGRVSIATDLRSLPTPDDNITLLQSKFASKGLNLKDLAVLSGGHTIGTSFCSSFSTRLYNFSGKGDSDPAMDPNYMARLKNRCKPGDTTTLVEMDPGSFKTFDTKYYQLITKRRGLFTSDQALLADSTTRAYVKRQQAASSSTFLKDFQVSMVNMGKIGVLTGKSGEIRKHCAIIN